MKTDKRKIRSISGLLTTAMMLMAFFFQSNAQVSRSSQINFTNADFKNTSAEAYNITLQLTKISDGIVRLDWTLQPGNYELIRTDPFGNSDTIYRGTDLTYTDIITSPYCDSTYLSYRVEITGLGGSSSNIITDVFLDNNKPADVVMDSISIDPSGHPIVTWIPGTSGDVAGYEIQQLLAGGVWQMIGFAPGNLTTSFISDSINACAAVKTFAIITLDQCNNKSTGVGTYPKALNTLFMETPVKNECKGTILLTWNSYNNMNPALGEYQIYLQEGSKSDSLIGTTSPGITTFTDTRSFTNGVRYSYYVHAVSQDGMKSSTSCKSSFISSRPLRPDTLSLNYVTVRNSQYVEMGIHFGPLETVKTIRILRSSTGIGRFDTIASITPGNLEDMVIDDTTASVNQQSYYSKIDVLDECDETAITSDVARTIYLTCQANNDESNALSWNDYEGWRAGIDHYDANRFVNNIPDPGNPIHTSPQGNTTYIDPPSATLQAGNVISYQVEAFEKNTAGGVSSLSNIVTAVRQPIVMIPNAFAPKGINQVFRPKMRYVDNTKYQMLIFNKWGQQIFETSDLAIPWDGKQNGEYVPIGIYFYRLEYSSFSGEIFTKTGAVVVVQ